MFRNQDNEWYYERYNYSYYEDQQKDIIGKLGEIERAARTYKEDSLKQIEEAKED